MKEIVLKKIRKLTKKKNVRLTDGGNSAIFIALLICKQLGKKRVYIPDMAGWITYEKYPLLLDFELKKVKTDYGIVKSLEIEKDSVVLWQNMPGYFAIQDMEILLEECNKKNSILINDCTADPRKSTGHINVCSFGNDKPINVGYGGFVATDLDEVWKYKDIFDIVNVYPVENLILDKIKDLDYNLERLKKLSKNIKKELKGFDIIHKSDEGINVIIRYKNEKEKKKIIKYCESNGYEFTQCPRYIRVMDDAISIEVKRKTRK